MFLTTFSNESYSQCTYCPGSTTSNNGSALGYYNTANGTGSIAIGVSSTSSSQSSIAIGRYLTVASGFPYNILMGTGYCDAQRLVYSKEAFLFLMEMPAAMVFNWSANITNVLEK